MKAKLSLLASRKGTVKNTSFTSTVAKIWWLCFYMVAISSAMLGTAAANGPASAFTAVILRENL